MQTENANCESYCRRTLSSSWLSKINLRRNLINYLRTLCKVRMRTVNIIAEELWLSEINFKWFTINLSLHVRTENVNCTFYCWRTLITQDKFQEIYNKFIFACANWERELCILLLKNSESHSSHDRDSMYIMSQLDLNMQFALRHVWWLHRREWWTKMYKKNHDIFYWVHFHHIMLDEAQIIKNFLFQNFIVCKDLMKKHRWMIRIE